MSSVVSPTLVFRFYQHLEHAENKRKKSFRFIFHWKCHESEAEMLIQLMNIIFPITPSARFCAHKMSYISKTDSTHSPPQAPVWLNEMHIAELHKIFHDEIYFAYARTLSAPDTRYNRQFWSFSSSSSSNSLSCDSRGSKVNYITWQIFPEMSVWLENRFMNFSRNFYFISVLVYSTVLYNQPFTQTFTNIRKTFINPNCLVISDGRHFAHAQPRYLELWALLQSWKRHNLHRAL